ncbi:hypothetical protein ARMGADRAFT_1090741 [Armillaria gallica]|uniref:Uncharacterized protein n=1 Tax=Armillaria gallica TaxID=47427 RepID=A0A2H3CG75_ARMGA|nr:hypothetical protein ARMGADRAFT_1090741 [Armillaria gallica]
MAHDGRESPWIQGSPLIIEYNLFTEQEEEMGEEREITPHNLHDAIMLGFQELTCVMYMFMASTVTACAPNNEVPPAHNNANFPWNTQPASTTPNTQSANANLSPSGASSSTPCPGQNMNPGPPPINPANQATLSGSGSSTTSSSQQPPTTPSVTRRS